MLQGCRATQQLCMQHFPNGANMAWIVYVAAVLIISLLIGLHLGRFREAYTEMTGMMAGMTMGMLNGFLMGYAAAGLFNSMFWGNLVGILLGTALGCFFGRAGGLMGIMDGGMGGVMGGSMGAMLMVMLVSPQFIAWTAVLLAIIYLVGMAGLVVLIEQSAPEHAALHRLLPMFARAMRVEAAEQSTLGAISVRRAPIENYYTFLGVTSTATGEEITAAYLDRLSIADGETIGRAERALSILNDPNRRRVYDARLAASQAAGDCCPPRRAKRAEGSVGAAVPSTASTVSAVSAAASAPARASVAVAPPPSSRPAAPTSRQNGKHQQAAKTSPASNARQAARPKTKRTAKKESPISWVGGVAAFGIATLLIGWWLLTQNPFDSAGASNAFTDNGRALPADFVQKLQTKAVDVPLVGDGKQTLDLVVNGNSMSYKPDVIRVKQGTPVHFNLSVEGRDPGCGRYVGLRGLGVHGIANPGETTTLDFTPAEVGIFQINCNMQMMNPGYLIVTE
jgi:plastocyanin